MVWSVVTLSCLWSWLLPVNSIADPLRGGDLAASSPKLPPIAGIPYADVGLIVERHREELMRLPGVQGVGLGAEGISVWTDNPAIVPSQVEGLPIVASPPPGPLVGASHTLNTRIRPLHGGVAATDNIGSIGTLTGVGLSQGRPWLIFPTHLLGLCSTLPPCPPAQNPPSPPVNTCPHTQTSTTQLFVQPPQTVPELVGLTQRWDQLRVGGSTTDTAASFLENELPPVEGNGSISADRVIEAWSGSFTGLDPLPIINEVVSVRIMNPPHFVSAYVTQVNQTVPNIHFGCINNQTTTLTNQILLTAFSGSFFAAGDSGSPVLDGSGFFDWNGCSIDKCSGFGASGDKPVVWNKSVVKAN